LLDEQKAEAEKERLERERKITEADQLNISDVQPKDGSEPSDTMDKDYEELALKQEQDDLQELQDLDGKFDPNAEEEIFDAQEQDADALRPTLAVDHLTLDNPEAAAFMAQAMRNADAAEKLGEIDDKPKKRAITKATGVVKIDPALIKQIWPYLRADEEMIDDETIEENGEAIMAELADELEICITKLTAKIKSLSNETSSDDAGFELSSICSQGLEILQDCPIDFEDWQSSSAEQEWVIRTLKIWFFMIKDFAVIHKWASWPAIFDDQAFIKKAQEIVEEKASDDFYDYLLTSAEKLVLDDPAHLAKVECLIKHLGGSAAIDPHHADGDSSVGTFMMFILKDALQFAGLLPDKKKYPAKELKICNYKKGLYEQLLGQLQNALGQ
jgi:hypothetical protein